jgi:hypothetical protein
MVNEIHHLVMNFGFDIGQDANVCGHDSSSTHTRRIPSCVCQRSCEIAAVSPAIEGCVVLNGLKQTTDSMKIKVDTASERVCTAGPGGPYCIPHAKSAAKTVQLTSQRLNKV